MKKVLSIVCISIFSILLNKPISYAIMLNGSITGIYAPDIHEPNPDGKDVKVAEERFQLTLNIESHPVYTFFKGDVFYDHLEERGDYEIRELYIDYLSDRWDLIIGRQIITWGIGDLLFINDIFPKDYESFYSGRPMEYMKRGIDGLRLGLYPESFSVEVVIIPFFRENIYPGKDRFWQYNPLPQGRIRNIKPSRKLINTEMAIRLYGNVQGVESSFYFYRGFFRYSSLSEIEDSRLLMTYPELSVYGVSLEGQVLDGILGLEMGFYDSRDDRAGDDPMIPNQSIRMLTGYRTQLLEDITAGIQWYSEYMLDYSDYKDSLPEGYPLKRRIEHILTLRLNGLFWHETLGAGVFTFIGIPAGDFHIIPEVKYALSDQVSVRIGANIFGGGEDTDRFGSLDKNDNIFANLRYSF